MRKTKNQQIQVKAGPADGLQDGQFRAYASVFDVKDSYGDVVQKGAFTDTIAAWKSSGLAIPLLFGHNMSDPDFNIGEILDAVEDDHGLLVTGQLDLESPKAAQTYRLLKGKRINQMSYAYDVLEGGPAKDETFGDYYSLVKLQVFEFSIVPLGANQETEILAVKTAVESLLGLKEGRTLSAKNETSLREARDAIDSVLSSLDSAGDQGKASPPGTAKDEEPAGAKSEEPNRRRSADSLLAVISTHERD